MSRSSKAPVSRVERQVAGDQRGAAFVAAAAIIIGDLALLQWICAIQPPDNDLLRTIVNACQLGAAEFGYVVFEQGREDREGRPGAVCGFDLVEPLLKSVYIAVKEM